MDLWNDLGFSLYAALSVCRMVTTLDDGEKSRMGVVVATTRWNGTCSMLTSAKLSIGYLVVGITRELDKEPLLHCSSIYINYMWSILQQYLSGP